MSSDSVPRTFNVGDRVRELQTNEERYVIEEDGDVLIVLADESKGKFSNRRRWLKQNCTVITPCPFHITDKVRLGDKSDVVGEVVEIKPHYTGKWLMYCVERPHPDGKGKMTHWANEGALHLVTTSSESAKVEPVAYESSPTESLPADDDFKPIGFGVDSVTRAQLEKQRDEAQQLRADAEERARVAELNNAKLLEQVKRLEAVVVKPVAGTNTVAPPPPCYEVKIERFRQDLPEDARRWSQLLYEGWKENSINAVIDSGDRIYSVVVFKKLAESTPQPTQGTAGAHASLTADYVQTSRQANASQEVLAVAPDEIILEPVSRRVVGPIEASIRANGVEDTIQTMNGFAIEQAFIRARQRIEATPAFNRPLHSLKASN